MRSSSEQYKISINLRNSESRWLEALKEKWGILLALAIIVIIFTLLSPYFFSMKNFIIILRQNSVRFILATAMTIVIVSGGIDLSIGSNMVFSGIVGAITLQHFGASGIFIGICFGLSSGIGIGLLNGLMIGKFKIDSWLITLAMLTLIRGFAYVISHGRVMEYIPQELSLFITQPLGFMPVSIWIAILIGVIFHFFLSSTILGSSIKGMGSNTLAATYCGISINHYYLLVYGISGFLAAVASIMILGSVASIAPYSAVGIELDAIAGAVIGGTSFDGGIGSISGTAIGIMIIGVIQNGLTILGLSSSYLKLFRGLILVIVVIIDAIRKPKT